MQISKIGAYASKATQKLGETILDNKPDTAKVRNFIQKTNKFVQGEGYNPGRGAYYLLMGGCVVAPRFLKARDNDERREVLTRDITTVVTILFAMKALQSGMCSAAQKKSGLTLVNDTVGKANIGKRILGFLNPEGGITALGSDEVIARYSRFDSKDSFIKTLKTLDKEGGTIAKVFNLESKKGERPMYVAAKKLFGDNFLEKSNQELIEAVENAKNGTAVEGLEALIGSKAAGVKNGTQKGILNNASNPITNYARNISANFNTLSLGITAGFLGFGIAKINELLTAKKHLNKPGTNPNRGVQPEMPQVNSPIYTSISKNNNSSSPFSSFMKLG